MQSNTSHEAQVGTVTTAISTNTTRTPSQDNFCSPANSEFYNSNPYSDLNRSKHEIRVLRLAPVQEGTPLSADLITISLKSLKAENHNFIAISYSAGSHIETEAMYVNGVRFNAFANLARALRQAVRATRKPELHPSPQLIWADQICINQSDPAEKSYQVGFMREIYQSAGVVLGSLGDDPSNGRCIEVTKYVQFWSGLSIELQDTKVLIEGHLVADFRNEQFQQDWSALQDMFRCAWWQRGWVYQEVVVARRVVLLFGDFILDWDTLTTIVRVLRLIESLVVKQPLDDRMDIYQNNLHKLVLSGCNIRFAEFMVNGREDWAQTGEKKLIGVLEQAQVCKVSDIRDRIFAFLGLAGSDYGIIPDYTIPPHVVFSLACKRIILHERSLNVLCCCRSNFDDYSRRLDIPSWTPDWSLPDISPVDFIYDPVDDLPPFRASGDYLAAAAFPSRDGSSGRLLRVQCLFVDDVATEESLGPQPGDEFQTLKDWRRIVGLKDNDLESRYTMDPLKTLDEAFKGILFRGMREEPIADGTFRPSLVRRGRDSLEMGRIFRSPKHYIGVTKMGTDIRPTDRICVILGANVPFILREVEDHFVLISDAYVEGLMYGEAIEMMQQGILDVVTVEIH
ncbi:hypothetical protein EKO04_002513 [Ascochyta lentis]|uniref:Heterokaryon incompatibility domain-containing protein n=1 Tax=Ascochyta lentis TaxID=205686 RepID=A0A8H7JC37_9PLEO|nr:hypothetical protein EKO04_002513 [Ascochyta lentis]